MMPITLTLALVTLLQIGLGRTVLATVLDPRNQPIVDLEVDDFVIREAGQPREVLSARIADYPIVVLIDTSAAEFSALRSAAASFITRVGQRPVALGTLGSTPAIVSSFDEDRATLLERLSTLAADPSDRSQVVEGIANGARALSALDVQFSAIVVISAGPPAVAVRDSSNDSLRQILDSHAIVDVVVNQPSSGAPPNDELRALTEQTRGQLTTIYTAASFEIALNHLADQMAGEMMIDYIVPGNALRKEDVTVGVRIPGARVKGLGVR